MPTEDVVIRSRVSTLFLGVVLLGAHVGCTGDPVLSEPSADGSHDILAEAGSDGPLDDSVLDATDATEAATDSATDGPTDAATDTLTDTSADAPTGSDPACGTHKGGAMVHIASAKFCIDATEVTASEYVTFRDAADKGAVPAYCAWNTGYAPAASFGPDGPMTNVNWCQAQQYCLWAGKHLCSKVGTDQPGTTGTGDTMWGYACGNSLGTPWATGSDEPGVSAVCTLGVGKPVSPKAPSKCHGASTPYDRIVHLNGNVREWDGAGCAGLGKADAGSVYCGDRGGYFGNTAEQAKCTNGVEHPIDFSDIATGFRCCKNLP
ncbi:MAG: SUMF1/EgtB/PvdO family nonheme iron enzyme [Myxococcales bacterium]|nr:SUMF1/EgtB/PvdO family nonheme iron enzyme [Myxococcales bacterium]